MSNQQWAIAMGLFATIVDGAEPSLVIAGQADPGVRAALENLWRQHNHAEKLRFLDDQMTVVSELSASGPAVFQPGQILSGRFAILRLLGRGGMGEVYLADDQRLMETVALKTIKRELAKDKENRARFLAEVQNSRRVTHPNVCRIFDLFEHDGIPFFSMEYVAGPTLAEVLAVGPLHPERAKLLAMQTAEGLWTAHKNGILHCDFKPANIILAGSGKTERAVITDFGLARALGHADLPNQGHSLAGTPPYMAPELLRAQPATVRTDIYAFGKVLEAMLPGHMLAPECAATHPDGRPESLELVLDELRGVSTRRTWLGGLLIGAAVSSLFLYERSRPKIPLGSRQRVRVNGFQPAQGDTAQIVRNLLIMALRQSPLLSVVGDRTYLASNGSATISAGLALPIADLLTAARDERANLAIEGKLENAGAGLRLLVNVYDTSDSSLRYSSKVKVLNRRNLVQLVELAAADLRLSAFGESTPHSSYMPLEQITSASPEAVDLYFRAVFFYEEKSDATSAIDLLNQALSLDPGFVLAYHYRALALTAKAMVESAQASEEKAFANRLRVTERERNWIDSQYYNITGDWRNSAEALRKNTVLFPDEAIFQRQLAFALMRLGRYEEAIPYNRRAVDLDPFSNDNSHELLMNLAEANQVEDCFAEAKKFEAAGRTPNMIHRELALAYMQKRDYPSSLSECRQFGDGTSERESWSRLISVPPLVMSGRFAEAIQWIEGDLALDSSRPAIEKEEYRTHLRRNSLGHLYRLRDSPAQAAEQAAALVGLRPIGANLIHLREGCALAFDLNEIGLAEQGLDRLRALAAKWPSSHSKSAVWLNQAMLKEAQGENDVSDLFAKAKGAWPDPLNLFYAAQWERKSGLCEAQLASLAELDRLRGKVFKYHFAGLVVLGWLEQAKCLQSLSRFEDSLRMYQRVLEYWRNPQAAGRLVTQAREERDVLLRRLQ